MGSGYESRIEGNKLRAGAGYANAPLAEIRMAAARPLPASILDHEAQIGSTILDTRSSLAFARGHIAGAINVGIDGFFATWIGSVIPTSTRIVLVTDPGRELEVTTRLQRLGYLRVVGWLEGGMPAWQRIGRWSEPLELIRAQELAHGNRPSAAGTLIDVRTNAEWDRDAHMRTTHIPLSLLQRQTRTLSGGPVTFLCDSGYRASIAASLLLCSGAENVHTVIGGWNAVNAVKRTYGLPL